MGTDKTTAHKQLNTRAQRVEYAASQTDGLTGIDAGAGLEAAQKPEGATKQSPSRRRLSSKGKMFEPEQGKPCSYAAESQGE